MTGEKTFNKNKARETTYKIKFNDTWKGSKLRDLLKQLHEMFDNVLEKAKGKENDLGRVIINHPKLNSPIVIPLDNWSNINSNRIMEAVERVLNSEEDLSLDEQMQVVIGNIAVPSGSGTLHITKLDGPYSSIALKRSMLKVSNNDQLCLATSIGRCFLKLCPIVHLSEWKEATKNDHPDMNTMMKVVKHRMTTKSFYNHVGNSHQKTYAKTMALTLCEQADVPTDRPLGLTDIKPFEDLLDVNVLVLSSLMGNKFYRVANDPNRRNIYLYLTESSEGGHFDGIGSINGFFGSGYFCETCLKPYKNKGKHKCETTCDVCGSDKCILSKDVMCCRYCNRTCRSYNCYKRHTARTDNRGRDVEKSMCEKTYQCRTCKKVIQRAQRKPEEHRCREWKCPSCFEYQLGQHFCYQRKRPREPKTAPRKYFFYDFETTQNERMSCDEGYSPGPPCEKKCTDETRCTQCRTCINCNVSWCGLEEHRVNYAVLQSTCDRCIDETLVEDSKCHVCGSRCERCAVVKKNALILPCENTCGYRQRVFKGGDVPAKFCSHIMTAHYRNTVLIAHNAKGFDNYPVLNALIDHHSVRPDKILYSGSKIMYMHVGRGLDLTFLDSMNFISMKLSKIPECFGLHELKKGYFPHLFNTAENQSYVGPYPDVKYYGIDYMSEKDRKTFLKWHASRKDLIFDFQKEMYDYCVSDVDILRRGCMRFRKIMMEVTSRQYVNEKGHVSWTEGIDPYDNVTIASTCQQIYRELFLEEEYRTDVTDMRTKETTRLPTKLDKGKIQLQLKCGEWCTKEDIDLSRYRIGKTVFVKSPIGIVPSEGYNSDTFSKASIQWLEWTMEESRRNNKPLLIRHALNGGEHRVPGKAYRLDGYDEESKTAYEFLGCVFHGCDKCYPHDRTTTTHPTTKHSMNELYHMTRRKEMDLKRLHYKYVCIWEHDFRRRLKTDDDMRDYLTTIDVTDRLSPRDSFFGGRTNALKLFHEVQAPGETIEYYDFTSLYPSINKYAVYPIGHPIVITSDFKDISEYFGLAKVKIMAPRKLLHPVLPYISNGKLKFPLCKKCADTENENDCACDDSERSITGTWCTPELNKAVSKGYTILKIYEVYHFEETRMYDRTAGVDGLFSGYVDLFLKLKQEASGFPNDCETDEQKNNYICEYFNKEGIQLDFDQIRKNPGLRSLAKICLNSFWGKFGQRPNMKQTAFLYETEAERFFQILTDPRKDVRDFHIINDEIIQMEYLDNPSFLPTDFRTNIFLASFTTAWSRLKLYSLLEKTEKAALYVDTDSIIFVDKDKTISKTLPVGNHLGELTNEISPNDGHITQFVSGGPKNYAYRTASGTEVVKVRGFTLQSKTDNELINFSSIRDIVVEKKQDVIKTRNPRKISRLSMKRKLYNRIEEKDYRMVYTKRRLLNDLTTLPFGYRE